MNLAMNRASQRNKARRKMDDFIKSGNTGHSVIKGSKAKGINDIHVFSDGTNAVAYQKNKSGKEKVIFANYKLKNEVQVSNYDKGTIHKSRELLTGTSLRKGGAPHSNSKFSTLIKRTDKKMKTITRIGKSGSRTLRSKIGSSGG